MQTRDIGGLATMATPMAALLGLLRHLGAHAVGTTSAHVPQNARASSPKT